MTPTPPTRARFVVIALMVTLAVITSIDRVGISVALPGMRKDLGLTTIEKVAELEHRSGTGEITDVELLHVHLRPAIVAPRDGGVRSAVRWE